MTKNKQQLSNASDEILERLSKQAVEEKFIRREEELFRSHVTKFASLLENDVARALKTPAEDVSKEFVDVAQALLRQIADEGSIPGQKIDKALNEDGIVQMVTKEIAEELSKGFVPPDQQEISSHAHELAQCVLSNWFALLQKAKDLRTTQTHPIYLNSDAMPLNAFATGLLFDGVEAFALKLETVEERFEQFLMSLAEGSWFEQQFQQAIAFVSRRPRYRVVELAPDLVLVTCTKERWFLAESVNEAKNFIQKLAPIHELMPVFELGQFNPEWVMSGVCALEWPGSKSRWTHQSLKGVIEMAANNAIHSRAENSQGAFFNIDDMDKQYQVLLKQVTELTNKTIRESLDIGHNSPSAEIFRGIRESVSDIRKTLEENPILPNESTMEICQAVIASATFAVAKCAHAELGKEEEIEELQEHFLVNQPDAKVVLDIATRTTTDILKSPEIQTSLMYLRSTYKENL
jgi:hypothetical protein